jgi:hydrogenase/urease accessory protein HupE
LSVRASPISKTAAILIIVVGVFVLFTGVAAGVPANEVAGIVFIALGVALYGLLLKFTRRVRTDFSGSVG